MTAKFLIIIPKFPFPVKKQMNQDALMIQKILDMEFMKIFKLVTGSYPELTKHLKVRVDKW